MMMKRGFSFLLIGTGIAVLAGCPIYPDDGQNRRVCLIDTSGAAVGGDCWDCPDSYYSAACHPWTCNSGADCPSGYSCNSDHRCKYTDGGPSSSSGQSCTKPSDCGAGSNCGADNKCHTGDCSTTGCPSSFVCKLASDAGGVPACTPVAGGAGTISSCKSDKDCPSPAGSKCLTGTCVAPQDQCADATQCAGGGQCVQGACTPSCSPSKPCPTGYGCDTGKGVCTGNPTPCTSSTQCGGGKVCVEEHCVEPCGAGGTCGAGLKCVDGGCTPDQQPVFTCKVDGQQDDCQPGSVCLRHSCYIACSADAGADSCKQADQFNQCKTVTTASGTHHVCGSTANLGTECDPTVAKNCTSPLICIDGYCK
jgi:hypothetical protein